MEKIDYDGFSAVRPVANGPRDDLGREGGPEVLPRHRQPQGRAEAVRPVRASPDLGEDWALVWFPRHLSRTGVALEEPEACRYSQRSRARNRRRFRGGGAEYTRRVRAARRQQRALSEAGLYPEHPEYETDTLSAEYHRDRANDPDYPAAAPHFPGDDPSRAPPNLWRHTAHIYTNWVKAVYESTPYSIEAIPNPSKIAEAVPLRRNRRQRLDELKTGDARPLPPHLKAQIARELDRLELLLEQIKAVDTERDALISAIKPDGMNADAMRSPPAMLINLNGIGPEFAAVLWSEGFYRSFANRRQVAAYVGLAPTPWQSGSVAHEQGVSKAGNPRLRTTMLQLASLWLRHQPQSALALWFHERFTRNGGHLRKTTIVAPARKLLVALWKYVTAGVLIEGAGVRAV